LGFGLIEDGKEGHQPVAEIGAIGVGSLDVIFEGAFFEDTGVVGEEAEEQTYQEDFEAVAGVVLLFEGIVKAHHFVGGVGVELDFGFIFSFDAKAGQAAEYAQVFAQLGDFEGFEGLLLFEVVDAHLVKIGEHEEAGGFFGLEGLDVGKGLGVGSVERLAFGFHLDEDLVGEKKINIVWGAIGHEDLMLGEAGAPVDTENEEEVGDEFLVLLLFCAQGRPPLFLEGSRAGFDFGPSEHRDPLSMAKE